MRTSSSLSCHLIELSAVSFYSVAASMFFVIIYILYVLQLHIITVFKLNILVVPYSRTVLIVSKISLLC